MAAASVGETCEGGICPRDELGEVTRDGEYQGGGSGDGSEEEEEGRDSPSCSFDPQKLNMVPRSPKRFLDFEDCEISQSDDPRSR